MILFIFFLLCLKLDHKVCNLCQLGSQCGHYTAQNQKPLKSPNLPLRWQVGLFSCKKLKLISIQQILLLAMIRIISEQLLLNQKQASTFLQPPQEEIKHSLLTCSLLKFLGRATFIQFSDNLFKLFSFHQKERWSFYIYSGLCTHIQHTLYTFLDTFILSVYPLPLQLGVIHY